MKQEQSEKTSAALKDTVHQVKEIAAKLKKDVEKEHKALMSSSDEIRKKQLENSSLKARIEKISEQLVSYFIFYNYIIAVIIMLKV